MLITTGGSLHRHVHNSNKSSALFRWEVEQPGAADRDRRQHINSAVEITRFSWQHTDFKTTKSQDISAVSSTCLFRHFLTLGHLRSHMHLVRRQCSGPSQWHPVAARQGVIGKDLNTDELWDNLTAGNFQHILSIGKKEFTRVAEEPTVFVGAESWWAGVRELNDVSVGPQRGFRQDVSHVAGFQVSLRAGQITHCCCGPDTVRVPLLVPTNPATIWQVAYGHEWLMKIVLSSL